MGTVAASRFDITALARDIVRSLAVRTEESAFLSVRRGDETVCLVREDGSFPIGRSCCRRGCGSPSRGIRGSGDPRVPPPTRWMPTSSVTTSSRAVGTAHSPARLRTRVADTKARGYAVNPGLIVEGSWGLGAAVFTRTGEPNGR